MYIRYNNETVEVDKVESYGDMQYIHIGSMEFAFFESSEEAGEQAREYWKDLAEHNPSEFTCIVGEKALVAWALGQPHAVGYESTNSLEEWLDLWLNVPEEHFAGYDGDEVQIDRISPRLADELELDEVDFTLYGEDFVMYRNN